MQKLLRTSKVERDIQDKGFNGIEENLKWWNVCIRVVFFFLLFSVFLFTDIDFAPYPIPVERERERECVVSAFYADQDWLCAAFFSLIHVFSTH